MESYVLFFPYGFQYPACSLKSSFADPDPAFLGHPDPDQGKYQIRILYPRKYHCNYNFLVILNCLKYSFVKIICLSLISSVIRCLDLVKMPLKKTIYFAKHQKHIRIRSFLGHPYPDPDP